MVPGSAEIDRLLEQIDEANVQQNWEGVKDLAGQILGLDTENADAPTFLRQAERRLKAATPEPAAPPPSLLRRRPLSVKRLLGEGAQKKVYLAGDKALRREVAFALIKTDGSDADARTRVLREAQTMGQLGASPHIVSAFDIGEEEGAPYLILEHMAGGDLESLIASTERTLPLE